MPIVTYTTPGTYFFSPIGNTAGLDVETFGAGSNSAASWGAGGGGGGYARGNTGGVGPGDTFTVVVGAGGTGSTGAGGSGASTFNGSSYLFATGGDTAGSSTHATGGGSAATATANGGLGGTGTGSGGAGGGGGGCGGHSGAGGNGGNAVSTTPGAAGASGGGSALTSIGTGAGGVGIAFPSGAGSPGAAPGGGAGGNQVTSLGADGAVVISYTVIPDAPIDQSKFRQRTDAPPDQTMTWWEANRVASRGANLPPPPAPPTHQASQQLYNLPNEWVEYAGFTQSPYAHLWVIPTPPPTHQGSQRFDPLPDYNGQWWEQLTRQPQPVTYKPPPPLINPQISQRFDPLPDYDYYKWEQFRKVPLPSFYTSAQEGQYAIVNTFTGVGHEGAFRIANDIAGFNIYIGVGTLPDFTQPATAFSQNLPMNITLTPPGSGTATYNVCVREQDQYGLQSVNQNTYSFTIDSSGNLILPVLSIPQLLILYELSAQRIQVNAQYPQYTNDQYKATHWKVWAGVTSPDPLVDVPLAVVNVTGTTLTVILPSQPPGLYHVAVALFRATDGALSPALRGTITLDDSPPEVIAVPSGFNQ